MRAARTTCCSSSSRARSQRTPCAAGSRKSTLLRTVNALERIDGGQVYVMGRPVHDKTANINELRTHVGMVQQSFNLFPQMTVLDNITLAPIRVKGLPKGDAEAKAHE